MFAYDILAAVCRCLIHQYCIQLFHGTFKMLVVVVFGPGLVDLNTCIMLRVCINVNDLFPMCTCP